MDDLKNPAYQPAHLLDVLIDKLDVKNDGALAHALCMNPAQLSKLRNKKMPLGPTLLIAMTEVVDLTVGQLRNLAGLPARMYVTRFITR